MNVSSLVDSRTEIFSVHDTDTVHDAARYLRDRQVRSVGVLDGSGHIIGVVSQSDISNKVAAENKCPAWMRVSEVMTGLPLVIVTPDASFDDCLRLMDEHGIYHLLIVDEDGTYRGMLSVSDLLRVRVSDEKARADLLESIIFERPAEP